jgi:hypothetical protein
MALHCLREPDYVKLGYTFTQEASVAFNYVLKARSFQAWNWSVAFNYVLEARSFQAWNWSYQK